MTENLIAEQLAQVANRRAWLEELLKMVDMRPFSRPPAIESEPRYSFTPEISESSRLIASRMHRESPAPRSAAATIAQATNEVTIRPSAESEAIVAKLRAEYGSVASFHAAREASQVSWKALVREEAAKKELKECTFQPEVKPHRRIRESKNIKITGLEKFVNRQERARSKTSDDGPGSGNVYTGKATKPVPFSFLTAKEEAT